MMRRVLLASAAVPLFASASALAQSVTVTAPDAPAAIKILQGQDTVTAAGTALTAPPRTSITATARDFPSLLLILQGKPAPAQSASTTTTTPAPAEIGTTAPTTAKPAPTTTTPAPTTTPSTRPKASASASNPAIYFPANPVNAQFPSPEESTGAWDFNAKAMAGPVAINPATGFIMHAPFLMDGDGVDYKIVAATSPLEGADDSGTRISIGGAVFPGNYPVRLIIRCRTVYWASRSGHWLSFNVASGGSNNVGVLPPACATSPGAATTGSSSTTGTASALPAMPKVPTPLSPAPGASGNTIKAGPSRAVKTLTDALAQVKAGDTIQLDAGTYAESPRWPSVAIKLVGSVDAHGKPATKFDCTAAKVPALSRQMGCLVPNVDAEIDNVEVFGAGMTEPYGGGTAGIRAGGEGNYVLNNVFVHDNQDGVFSGGYAVTWTINNSTLSGNGLRQNSGSATHNLYVSGNTVRLTLNNVTSIAPFEAHAIKSRAAVTTVKGGYFLAQNGSAFDFPDGNTQPIVIDGATIEKPAGSADHHIIGVGAESQSNGLAGVTITNTKFILNCDHPFFYTAGKFDVSQSNTWTGNKPEVQGSGQVTGLPQ